MEIDSEKAARATIQAARALWLILVAIVTVTGSGAWWARGLSKDVETATISLAEIRGLMEGEFRKRLLALEQRQAELERDNKDLLREIRDQ